jgi:hypothetical protein
VGLHQLVDERDYPGMKMEKGRTMGEFIGIVVRAAVFFCNPYHFEPLVDT